MKFDDKITKLMNESDVEVKRETVKAITAEEFDAFWKEFGKAKDEKAKAAVISKFKKMAKPFKME